MKVVRVAADHRRKAFLVQFRGQEYPFPFAACTPRPSTKNRVLEAWVDLEIGKQGFVYRLASGAEGTVLADQVLHYNSDPHYVADYLLYELTVQAQERLEHSGWNLRDLARRLHTSPTQLYRLLDPTNYRKSMRQMLSLLCLMDCEVSLRVRVKKAA